MDLLEKDTKKGIISYENSYLTFDHYKEPLKSLEKSKGFGYYGVLLSTLDGTLVQCHICGQLFAEVGKHANQKHKISASEYREKFDLSRQTALCSEEQREKRKLRFVRYYNSLSLEEQKAFRGNQKERIKNMLAKTPHDGHPHRLETKNKRGTCPDQLLERIKKTKDKLGHFPSKDEFILDCGSQRFYHLVRTTFGSWTKALEVLGHTPVQGKHDSKRKRYTDDELIEYLQIFAQENNKIPTFTDFNRGLLPAYETYTNRFGSIHGARELAGVYDIVDDEESLKVFGYKSHRKKNRFLEEGI